MEKWLRRLTGYERRLRKAATEFRRCEDGEDFRTSGGRFRRTGKCKGSGLGVVRGAALAGERYHLPRLVRLQIVEHHHLTAVEYGHLSGFRRTTAAQSYSSAIIQIREPKKRKKTVKSRGRNVNYLILSSPAEASLGSQLICTSPSPSTGN